MKSLTQERLRELLDYDPATGVFTWRMFRGGKTKKGFVAGSPSNENRCNIAVDGRLYYAHRLAWLYVHGRWPADMIDHIDGNPSNNRIDNLREATNASNQHNAAANPRNKLGVRGICKEGTAYKAQIGHQGRTIYLGRFPTIDEAQAAYRDAALRLHGSFVHRSVRDYSAEGRQR